jgi:hypothetical protein
MGRKPASWWGGGVLVWFGSRGGPRQHLGGARCPFSGKSLYVINYGNDYRYHKISVADPDPYVFGPPGSGSKSTILAPDPDPSIVKQNSKENLKSYCFVTSLRLLIFEK